MVLMFRSHERLHEDMASEEEIRQTATRGGLLQAAHKRGVWMIRRP